ncbi:ribonuclease Y [Candidatus Daviesbacteria bacterium]|nr:ribonuclease Y [Candidatus Daviesbacteria bacterium]
MKKTFGPAKNTDEQVNAQPSAIPVITDAALKDVSTQASLITKETELAKREGILEERERQIEEKLKILDQKLEQVEKVRKDLLSKLEKSSKMSAEDAQKILLESVEKDLASEISKKVKEAEDQIKLQADEKVREILADSMLHGVTDVISEFTTSKVTLEDEELKGRIIGKEGRNIRSFEQATGVDVVMDDESPNNLILSSFDPVRREIAKVSLERLIADGRIQPQRIEEIVEKTKEDIEKLMLQAGEKLCHDVGIYNMPVELMALLGRFKYRYSYGQNMIQHTLEETQIGVEIARQIGADVNVVKLGCLLHDIGKILTDWDEGTHVERGVQLAKKFGFPEKVVNCIAEHHEDQPFSAVESICVYLGDAISGGRPGARHENVQDYIKRLEDIERIATSFEAVEKAFAVQAGREVRVVVFPDKISDDELPKLVHDIGTQIQKEVMVPGAVKITAIRETRASDQFLTSGG